jgi:hypothetical protein
MLKRTALFLALCLAAVISPWAGAQTTQITASHIAYFGGTTVTGTFCLTPTNQAGQPINIVTSVGQQISPQVPLCFPITSGVLSSSAIVPDTSLTQPANACYNVVISNFYGAQVGVFPCVQPSGSTWSFDGFVPSSMPGIPALTFPQFKHNGTPNSSQASLNLVCSGCTESPAGTINIPAASLPSTSTYGLVPISTGVGTGNSWGQVPLSFGAPATQYVQQPLGNAFFPSFNVNFFGKRFGVEAFSSYVGVGSAVIAYNSSVDAPMCQVISYSGANYIALNVPNHATTPGTARGTWWPVPNNLPATNADCAGFTASAYTLNQHVNSLVVFGSGNYTSNQGFADYLDGSGFDDQFSVSFEGCGDGCTYLTYAGTAGIPVFNRTTGAGNFTHKKIHDMTIDGGGLASADIELGSLNQSYVWNISAGNVAPGSDHVVELGHFGGDGFQIYPTNVNIGIYPDGGTQNCGIFPVTLSGGAISSVGITAAGSCYNGTYPGLTVVAFRGYKNGAAANPCGTMPTGWSVTFTGSGSGVGVATFVPGTAGATCVGTVYAQVYQTPNVAHGFKFFGSDSGITNVTSYSGSVDAIYNGASDNRWYGTHPSVAYNGIYDAIGTGIWTDTELDDIGGCGITFQEPFTFAAASVKGTHGYVGSSSTSRLLYGSATYCLATANTYVNFGTSGPLLQASNPGPAQPVGWVEFVTPSGPIVNPGDYLTHPNKISVTGNDQSAGELMGDYIPILTVGTLNASTFSPASISPTNLIGIPLGTATLSGNFGSSTTSGNQASYCTGSPCAPSTSTASEHVSVGAGANPTIQRTFNIFPCPSTCADVFSEPITEQFGIAFSNNTVIDANGVIKGGQNAGGAGTPVASAGTIAGNNNGGSVKSLSAATSVTLTFANSGFQFIDSCTASASVSLATAPYVSALSVTAVTFTFPSLTGNLYYHCDGL